MLLSERNPEPGRTNRLQTLPHGGLPLLVALRSRARQDPEVEGDRALVLLATQPREAAPAKHPDEPKPRKPHPDEAHPDEKWIDPLYLFGCGVVWQKQRNAGAGWELIHCLSSLGQTARIAAALLAQTDDLLQPGPELVRAVGTQRKPSVSSEQPVPASRKRRRG